MSAHRRRRRRPVVLGVVITVLAMGSVAALAGVRMLGNRYESAVNRADLLPSHERSDTGKPEPPKVRGPLNLLLIGSDSRTNRKPASKDNPADGPQDGRSDVIMLVHIPKSTDRAYVVSIPRDTYMPIATSDGAHGARNKINAAFAWGGAPRLIQTLNAFIGDTIDYPIIIDFAGIRNLTDLVGGVDVVVDKTSTDTYRYLPSNTPYPTAPCRDPNGEARRCIAFKAGKVHLDGKLAEYYVRQRRGLPNDDLDRAKRHQQYLSALTAKLAGGDLLTNPINFDRVVRSAASVLTVDTSMPVQRLAFTLRNLRADDLTFMTLPIAENRNVPGVGAVMVPNEAQCRELFAALRNEQMDRYLRDHPPNDVSHGR